MKTFFKQRGLNTACLLVRLGISLYQTIADFICWILQLLGYGFLYLSFGVSKLVCLSLRQIDLYNETLVFYKEFDSEFIERRRIKTRKHQK